MYSCSICSKEFETIAAEAGHFSSHFRKKKIKPPIIHKCKYCHKIYDNGKRLGGHSVACYLNPDRFKNISSRKPKTPMVWTSERRKKLSISMKKYLELNPDKVPYLLNHKSKGPSFPETYFRGVFDNERIDLISMFSVGRYVLDFAFPDKKIDVEIDGEQHYVDTRIVEHDVERTQNLMDLGWTIYRIRWSHYKKMSMEEKKQVVDHIRSLVM